MKNIQAWGWPTAIVAVLLLIFSVYRYNKDKQDRQGFINMVEAQKDSTRYWYNRTGEEIATRKVIQGERDLVKAFLKAEDIAALEKRFDVKFKNVISAIQIATRKEGTLDFASDPQVVYIDTGTTVVTDCPPCKQVKYMTQSFGSPWDSVWVRVGDSAYAKVSSWDTTDILLDRDYTRKFLSKNWFTKVSVSNRNKNVESTVAGAFIITDSYRDKYFDLSAKGGYRYFNKDAVQSAPYLGAELNYYLKRAQLSGSYSKLLNNTKYYFVEVSGKFVLFRL